jgi:hypothetical protein
MGIVIWRWVMEAIFNYQMSIFGDFDYIKPNQDFYRKYLDLFRKEELIPTTFNISINDLASGQFRNESRMQLLKDHWVINFFPKRIDFNFSLENIENKKNENELSEISLNLFKKIFESEKFLASRLAINLKGVMKKRSQEQLEAFRKIFVPSIEFYNSNDILDWDAKLNRKSVFKIGKKREDVNSVSTVGLRKSSDVEDPYRIVFLIDINTMFNNQNARFDFIALKFFESEATKQISELIKQLSEVA